MVAKSEKHIFTSYDGIELAADIGGPADAPTVILLHGGGQTRHSWSGAMHSLLREGYRVINLDMRGHGESGWAPDNTYTLRDRARDVQTLIEAAGSERYAIAGASLGGMTAATGIGIYGLRPDALVLVDVVPSLERKGVERILEFMNSHPEGFANLEEAADAVAGYNRTRSRPRDPAGLRKNLREGADGRLRWHWDPGILSMGQEEDHNLFAQAMKSVGAMAEPPVLLVRGLESDIVSDRGVEALREMVPRVEVFDVAEAGHMVAGDRNDRFNEGTIAFLRRVLPVS